MSIFDQSSAGEGDPAQQSQRWMWAACAGLVACVIAWHAVGASPAVRFMIAAVVVGLLTTLMSRGIKQVTPEDEIDTSAAPAALVAPAGKLGSSEVTEAGWLSARSRHERLLAELTRYPDDPVLTRRSGALGVERDGPTAALYAAMHEAGALRTERFPGNRLARDYLLAVRRLAAAYDAARRHDLRRGVTEPGSASESPTTY